MDQPLKIPFYAKTALIFISLFAFGYVAYIGQQIIIPIVYATMIAILLNPFVNFLIRKRINKQVSILIAVTFAILMVGGLFWVISSQLAMFSETWPQLKIKIASTNAEAVSWFADKFNIRESKINLWIKQSQGEAIDNFAIGEKLTEAGRLAVVGMLLPVYLYMILYYKPLLLEFIRRLFRLEHHGVVEEVLMNSKKIIQTYITGLFFELIIMAVLNSAGLLLLGIDYAIILGILGAILNLIPYIGGVIAIALPMIIAFVTRDSITSPILVFCVYIVIQLIDNNYLIPKVVASRVKINALVSMIVVLIGGAIWGIPGMFLSIPLTAILKVVFDHIEILKPWGFLMGNIVPTTTKFSFNRQKETLLPK